MEERTDEAFEFDEKLTVVGSKLQPGQPAPAFTLDFFDPANSLIRPVTLAESAGRVRLLNVINSLDTPVCHQETHRWEALRPDLPWQGSQRMRGEAGLGLPDATEALAELADLAALDAQLGQDYPGATLEDIARLLWDCGSQDPFADPPGDWPARIAPLATAVSTPLLFCELPDFGATAALFVIGAVLTGFGSGFMWVMWGEYYAKVTQEEVEFLAPSSAVAVLVWRRSMLRKSPVPDGSSR